MKLLKAPKEYASFFLPKLGFGHGIGVPSGGRKIKGEKALVKGSNKEGLRKRGGGGGGGG